MTWFGSRGSVLVASAATLVGLTVLVAGGSAQSPSLFAAAHERGFIGVCTQRTGNSESKGDLNVRLRAVCAKGQKPLKLALYPAARGPQGPEGPQGPPGNAANAEFGVAHVFVSRGGGRRTRLASYSVSLGSPAGVTTGGQFRFSCKPTQAPCKISLGAAVISPRSGKSTLYPRMLIHKEDGPGAPMHFCEYADGASNKGGVNRISRAPSMRGATRAMRTPLHMGIGGSVDCGTSQTHRERVDEIWVPGATNGSSTAFYDVSVTLRFK
jgi:hypothetical protein